MCLFKLCTIPLSTTKGFIFTYVSSIRRSAAEVQKGKNIGNMTQASSHSARASSAPKQIPFLMALVGDTAYRRWNHTRGFSHLVENRHGHRTDARQQTQSADPSQVAELYNNA